MNWVCQCSTIGRPLTSDFFHRLSDWPAMRPDAKLLRTVLLLGSLFVSWSVPCVWCMGAWSVRVIDRWWRTAMSSLRSVSWWLCSRLPTTVVSSTTPAPWWVSMILSCAHSRSVLYVSHHSRRWAANYCDVFVCSSVRSYIWKPTLLNFIKFYLHVDYGRGGLVPGVSFLPRDQESFPLVQEVWGRNSPSGVHGTNPLMGMWMQSPQKLNYITSRFICKLEMRGRA